jgi:invasion protein IalB
VLGFVGMAQYGQWRLICVPGPAGLDRLGATAAPTGNSEVPPAAKSANACRINQEMPAPQPQKNSGGSPNQVIVAANFSLIGFKQTPVAMLRLPPTGRAGDPVGLRLDDGAVVQTPVRNCTVTECLAAGTLTASDWEHLSVAKSLEVVFPAAGGQWVLLALPVQGLSAAIAALKQAESLPAR